MLTLALSTVPTMTVVLIGILINNVRLNDTNARMNDLKEVLRAEIRVVDQKVDGIREVVHAELQANRAELDKNHSEMLHRFGDLDTRLTRIENSLGINRS